MSLSFEDLTFLADTALKYQQDRDLLLAWLPRSVTGRLKLHGAPHAQYTADVQALHGMEVPELERPPMFYWVRNLASMVAPFPEAARVKAIQASLAGGAPAPTPSAGSWWEALPLDWSQAETREALRIFLGAYPSELALLALAAEAGLPVEGLPRSGTMEQLARALLINARSQGRLRAMLDRLLDDPSRSAYAERLRALMP